MRIAFAHRRATSMTTDDAIDGFIRRLEVSQRAMAELAGPERDSREDAAHLDDYEMNEIHAATEQLEGKFVRRWRAQ